MNYWLEAEQYLVLRNTTENVIRETFECLESLHEVVEKARVIL